VNERFAWLAQAAPQARSMLVKALDQKEKNHFDYQWELFARPEQLPPPGNWRTWMIMAGRGFGKTRAGAEWVRMIADQYSDARIALVSASLAEARAVMVEGESGLLAVFPPDERPVFEPSLHRIRFASGAVAQLFSAAEPESLRGPQHSHACRAGAERVFRKSGARNSRRAGPAGRHRLTARAAGELCGRRVLQG
jgi:phage terminase large subunit-like protein